MSRSGFPFNRWLNVAVAVFVVLLLIALILPAVEQAREAARRTQVKNSLHQFGLALHNYHDTFRCFPPGGVIGGDGTPYHGWCMMLGPYMDASPLYSRIDHDVPWDDPENDFLWLTPVPWCLSPQVAEQRTPEGYGLLHYMANPHLMYRNSSVTVDDLSAGAANTWAIGEAGGEFTPYAYPFNWRPLGTRLNAGTTGFGLPEKRGSHLLFADGSVRFLSTETSADVLRAIADVPPVPKPQEVEVPRQTGGYKYSGRHEKWISFGKDEFPPTGARALLDRSEIPIRVTFICYAKNPDGCDEFTNHDVRDTVTAFPGMEALYGTPVITDEIADCLASLRDLETLHAEGVSLSERGLRSLASFPKLRHLWLRSADDVTAERLETALPDCEIQITQPRQFWKLAAP